MAWFITTVIAVVVSVVMIFVNKLFLEDPADYLKKQVAEIRREAKTKKQRQYRKMLVSSFVGGVRGHGPSHLMLLVGFGISLSMVVITLIITVGGLLAVSISPSFPVINIVTTWLFVAMALLSVANLRKVKETVVTPSKVSSLVGTRVSTVIEVMRDVATKDELRQLARLRINVYDEKTLYTFFACLFNTAKKYDIHGHIVPFVIWPDEFAANLKDLSESDRQLHPDQSGN